MPSDVIRFGNELELDRSAYELRRSGRSLKLERIPMELLLLLVERRGELVTRESIIERIWGKDVFLDTDSSINAAIRKIRQALKDDPERPLFVQTITGKGYRFVAPVENYDLRPLDKKKVELEKTSRSEETPQGSSPSQVASRRSSWVLPLVGVMVLILAGGAYFLRSRARSKTAYSQERVMLAVLPFANLSNDPEQEYFTDGLTEETITDLGELNPQRLGVIARTSAMAYKNTNKTVNQIGHELGADYVLEGSVRREGGTARITAQLIRVSDQSHIWAHNYEREVGGILALQNELGRAIAQQIQVKLTPLHSGEASNRNTTNPDAYDLYLKGRFYLGKRTDDGIEKGIEYFKQSIEKDPGFALGYAGLADSYLALTISSPQDFFPMARAAASRALELDEGLAEAHAALGAEKAGFEYDWAGAEQEFKRAIELNANCADAHFYYSWYLLTPLGRSEEAIAEMNRALELDPLSGIYNTVLGLSYYYARQYDQALQQFNKTLTLDPDFFIAPFHLAWLYSQLGQYPEAITELTKGRLLRGDDHAKVAADEMALRKAVAAQGAAGFWHEIRKWNEGDYPNVGEFDVPQAYARLGEKEQAMVSLERNFEKRAPLVTLLKVDPALDTLHSDPRFEDLLRRMNLPQ
ncbi:MAG: winged helix-turn-helix domain-containing protein [Terriglobales bacterium]|jgi:TolB-like protein/DNA-binding winged helix-turn-helix (wHTH) protein